MKLSHLLLSAGVLAGISVAAFAAVDQARRFAPPTAAELGLSGAYVTQWNELREQTLTLRASTRDALRQRLHQLDDLLADTSPDLDAFNRESEHEADRTIARARALKAKKLAFYDSLPSAQQAHVRLLLRERIQRLEKLPALDAAAGDAM